RTGLPTTRMRNDVGDVSVWLAVPLKICVVTSVQISYLKSSVVVKVIVTCVQVPPGTQLNLSQSSVPIGNVVPKADTLPPQLRLPEPVRSHACCSKDPRPASGQPVVAE